MLTSVETKAKKRIAGTPLGYRIFESFIKFGGRRLAYAALYWVVAYYALYPSVRTKCSSYIKKRFDGGRLQRFLHTYRLILHLGKILIDRAVLEIEGPDAFTVAFKSREILLKTVSARKGLILLTSHVGCWQVAMPTLGFLDLPIHLLVDPDATDLGHHYFEYAQSSRFNIIDPNGPLGGTLEMMMALKKGEIVTMMGDRLIGSPKNRVTVDFLGTPALFPFSAFKLASATGAPIVALFTQKTGPDSYAIYCAPIIELHENLGRQGVFYQKEVAQYVLYLEQYVQAYPYQFFNFYDIWQSPSDDESLRVQHLELSA